MANYQVTYKINVLSEEAIQSIGKFQRAAQQMTKAAQPFRKFQQSLNSLRTQMDAFSKKAPVVQLRTSEAERKVDRLIGKLKQLQKVARETSVIRGGAMAGGGRSTGQTSRAPISTTRSTTNTPATPVASRGRGSSRYSTPRNTGSRYAARTQPTSLWPNRPQNLTYKAFGPTPLPGNGGMAIDMLKGMGIAYGIAGVGQVMSNIIQQSAEYDNTMKTVENILKSHDNKDNFAGRLAAMQQTVRNVGMETKYKVTEVADAAKFLAMAGLDVDAIKTAIRPIADIALVGDTDLGETADLVTNIMTAYNIRPDRMRNAADVMTNTFTMSNTTLTEIAEAYKYSAALLSAGGVNFQESAAAIGVLGNAGIKGSQAGTTLRTIMANIVNPTKKQAGAWEKVGIDTSGKSLIDIFKELNSKDLDVADYYKLFHKTAAQGAVALAAHVEDWNKIMVENFLSDGIAKRLADEKKNTIQGLWAQLTSVFTDNGVTAFSKVDGVIRNALQTAINFLKSDDAKNAFDYAFKTMMEFGKIIVEVTKTFAQAFSIFKPFIMGWMKFQLYIWPVVTAFKALRSLLLGFAFIKNISLSIRGLAVSMMTLKQAMRFFGYNQFAGTTASGNGAVVGPMSLMGFGFLPSLSNKQMAKATRGLNLARPHASTQGYLIDQTQYSQFDPRYQEARAWNAGVYAARAAEDKENIARYRNDKKTLNKRVRWQQAKNGLKGVGSSLAGGAAMMAGMYEFTREDGNTADKWAGGLYSLAGTAAMVGGPIGWGVAGIAALGGVIVQFAASAQRSTEALQRLSETASKSATVNGILQNTEDKIQKALDITYNKHDDINTKIAHRVNLMKELLGLTTDESTPTDTTTSVYESVMKDFEDVWDSDLKKAWSESVPTGYGTMQYRDGSMPQLVRPDGTVLEPTASQNHKGAIIRSIAAANQLMSGGYYTSASSSINAQFAKLGLGGASATEWSDYFDTIEKNYNPARINGLIPLNQISPADAKRTWDGARILQDEEARRVVYENLMSWVSVAKTAIDNYNTARVGGTLTEDLVAEFIRYTQANNEVGKAFETYNLGTDGWYRSMGYWDNTFNGMSVYNDQTKTWDYFDANTMAQTTLANMERVNQAIKTMGLEADPAGIAIMNHANTLISAAQAFLGHTDEVMQFEDQQIYELNGLKYQYDALSNSLYQLNSDGTWATTTSYVFGLQNAVSGFGSTIGNYNWNGLFNSMIPSFSGINFNSGFNFGGGSGLNLNSSTPYSFGKGTLLPPLTLGSTSKFGVSWQPGKGFVSGNNWGFQRQTNFLKMTPLGFTSALNYNNTNTTTQLDEDGNPIVNPNKTTHNPGGNQSDYKSHYNNNTAAPKQVIVKIDKLLGVEKIDLSKPDNAEAIQNIKSQLAQALVDVVHDFDETWHG